MSSSVEGPPVSARNSRKATTPTTPITTLLPALRPRKAANRFVSPAAGGGAEDSVDGSAPPSVGLAGSAATGGGVGSGAEGVGASAFGAPGPGPPAGSVPTTQQTIHCARRGGRVVWVGLAAQDEFEMPVLSAIDKELDIAGIFRYANVYPKAISMVAAGKIDVKSMITRHFDFAELPEAIAFAANPVHHSAAVDGDRARIDTELRCHAGGVRRLGGRNEQFARHTADPGTGCAVLTALDQDDILRGFQRGAIGAEAG